jgi:hypothetical protein
VRTRVPTARAACAAGVVCVLLAGLPPRVEAQTAVWAAVGPTAGGLGLDPDLADYRWDTRPAAQWGARALVGRGPLAVGIQAWRAGTTQGTGLPEADTAPHVALTSLAAVALARVAAPLGCEVWLGCQAGRLHATWEPGELVVAAAGGEPVTVHFNDVEEWCLGVVVEVERQLGHGLVASAQAERSGFALDTAHRNGDAIEFGRDRFAAWSARLQLAWRWSL